MVDTIAASAPELSEQAEDALRRCAHELLLRSAEIAAEVTGQVLTALPGLVPHRAPAGVEALRESTDQNIGAIFSTLAFGVPATATEPPLGARRLMRHTLRGGGDITDMLRAYRLGHELVWQRWSDYVSTRLAGDEVLTEVLAHSSRHMFTFIDRCCDHLVREYRTEFGTMRPSGFDREPAEVVRELLGEGPIDESAASAQLRHDVRGHHIALVAAPLEAGGDAPLALDAVSRAAGGATLRLPVGDSTWWAWLTWPAEPSPAALAAIVATDLHGVLITMGDPGKGRAGFRRSHHQAREADRAARVGSAPPAKVVRHRDVELAGVLCTDPDRAQRLAEDRLGALAARNETCARLRETLLVFISLGCSKTRTAAQLHLHHKTVSYRLAQAEELLGRSPTEDVLELGTALLINRTLRGN